MLTERMKYAATIAQSIAVSAIGVGIEVGRQDVCVNRDCQSTFRNATDYHTVQPTHQNYRTTIDDAIPSAARSTPPTLRRLCRHQQADRPDIRARGGEGKTGNNGSAARQHTTDS